MAICIKKNNLKKKKYSRNVYRSLVLVTQFGINMLVPILLCSYAGLYLDRKLGTSFIMIVLFFLGAAAGFRNIYIMARDVYSSDDKKITDKMTEGKRRS